MFSHFLYWGYAFKKGTQDNYDDLTFLEKVGANLVIWYLIKGGLMERLEEIYMDR